MSRGGRESGFTLIEVLVALVVTALLMTLVLQAALDVRARQVRAEDRSRALLLAAELISTQVAQPAGNVQIKGRRGRIDWEVTQSEMTRDTRNFFALSRIEVRLFDKRGKLLYAVATRKLKPLELR